MEIEINREGDEYKLTVVGPIDNVSVDQLRSAFEDVYGSVPSKVRLDLRAVSTINSSGIGKILMLYKNLRKENGTLEISGISDSLYETFQLIKLDKIISIQR